MTVRVKICGITRLEDARAAAEFGADALGFVFAPSPRRITPEAARLIIRELPPFVTTVGVFVDSSIDEMTAVKRWCGLDVLQLHGNEPPTLVRRLPGRLIKTISVGQPGASDPDEYTRVTFLLDTYVPETRGGTGKPFDWSLTGGFRQPFILAGGLNPDNIHEAINRTRAHAVDVSSGVERAPGEKDHERIGAFIQEVRRWDNRA